MPNTTDTSRPTPARVSLKWIEALDVHQALADEALIQYAGDRVYLTIGQIELPLTANMAEQPATVHPVARLVFSYGTFHKLLGLLNRVADAIPKPDDSDGDSNIEG